MYKTITYFLIGMISNMAVAVATTPADSIPKFKLGLFDISTGLDMRYNHINTNFINFTTPGVQDLPAESRSSGFYGAFFRIQTSFIDTYVNKNKRKFRAGDLISGEISLGFADSRINSIKTGFLPLYNFEVGFTGLWHASRHWDISVSLALLKFGRDFFSDYFGGSNYFIRIRYNRWVTDLGWISENKLYFGAFNFISRDSNIPKVSIGLRYFYKAHNGLGVRIELLPATSNYEWWYGSERTVTCKLFYNLNF